MNDTMTNRATNTLSLGPLPVRFSLAGAVLLGLSFLGAIGDFSGFYRAYLVAFLLWLGVTLGCLALLMLQHLTGGRWALILRRILEAGTRTLPLMAVAALPILIGMKSLYVWARPGQTDPLIVGKHAYLNPAFFTVRMVFYFACWFTLAFEIGYAFLIWRPNLRWVVLSAAVHPDGGVHRVCDEVDHYVREYLVFGKSWLRRVSGVAPSF